MKNASTISLILRGGRGPTQRWAARLPFLGILALFCFAMSPLARAQVRFESTNYGDHAMPFVDLDVGRNSAFGAAALYSEDNGTSNTGVGAYVLYRNLSGSRNTAVGESALLNNTANDNMASGYAALYKNTTGSFNMASGNYALYSNTTANYNTAGGDSALRSNATGTNNVASGAHALYSNTTGSFNMASGTNSLFSNTTANYNTATGDSALRSNTTGTNNVASGTNALYSNTTASYNTASGDSALFSNTTGGHNTASGVEALQENTTGVANTACGANALLNNAAGNNNTAGGAFALFSNTGSNNVAVGYQAGGNLTGGGNNIVIGAGVLGTADEANITRIGKTTQKKTFIGGISGKTVPNGVGVIINSSGQLGTIQSSARLKEAIKPMDKASEALLALKPVTFRYKEELDPDKVPQFGLIAEEVAKVNPDLVVRDEDGQISTVRYEAVNAMLLNEFLKEHRRVEELEKRIQVLTATVQKVRKQSQPDSRSAQRAPEDF